MRMLWAGVCLALAGAGQAMTAEELVAKNIEARGGLDAIRALKSIKAEGKMVFGGGFELSYQQFAERGNKLRIEFSLQGLTGIQAYDGKDAWSVMPFQGRKDPDRMPPEAAKGLIDGADMDGPLIDWQAKGHKLRYLGTEDVDGTEAHKLEIVQTNGDVKLLYFDPDFFLQIREIVRRTQRGAEFETVTEMGDYEKVGGVYWPFSMATGPRGGDPFQSIELDKAEANVDIDDQIFAFPATPSTPTKAPGAQP